MTTHGVSPAGARRALVIGSGFRGLAASIRLGARGYNVTMLERQVRALGRARVFSDRVMTPRHFHEELLSEHGVAFSLASVLSHSKCFRSHNSGEDPGVSSSAKVLDAVVPIATA
jgi:phytoene dehydrogenase-like protein